MPFKPGTGGQIAQELSAAFMDIPGLWDSKRNLVDLDHLWSTPKALATAKILVEEALKTHGHWDTLTSIFVADTLKTPFGALPIASALSYTSDKSLIIWKEHGEYFSGRALMFGEGSQKEREAIGILHDVLAGGFAVIKMVEGLRALQQHNKKSYKVECVFSLVKLCSDKHIEDLTNLIKDISGQRIHPEQFIWSLDLSQFCGYNEQET